MADVATLQSTQPAYTTYDVLKYNLNNKSIVNFNDRFGIVMRSDRLPTSTNLESKGPYIPGYNGAITSSNVIDEMAATYNAAPAAVIRKKSDLRFYVSADVAAAYELAAASGNTQTYVTLPLGLTFLGIKVVVAEGMPTSTMVLTLKNNLIYAFDGEGDSKALKAVNLTDTVAEPYLRTRANMKVGFYYTNPAEIVVYSVCFD